MATKQFKTALRRLAAGVPVFRNTPINRGPVTFRVEVGESPRGAVFRGIVIKDGAILEVWEVPALDWLRRIACGYHPSLARVFGPARQYAGI